MSNIALSKSFSADDLNTGARCVDFVELSPDDTCGINACGEEYTNLFRKTGFPCCEMGLTCKYYVFIPNGICIKDPDPH